jgi:hypothetical protein
VHGVMSEPESSNISLICTHHQAKTTASTANQTKPHAEVADTSFALICYDLLLLAGFTYRTHTPTASPHQPLQITAHQQALLDHHNTSYKPSTHPAHTAHNRTAAHHVQQDADGIPSQPAAPPVPQPASATQLPANPPPASIQPSTCSTQHHYTSRCKTNCTPASALAVPDKNITMKHLHSKHEHNCAAAPFFEHTIPTPAASLCRSLRQPPR